MIDEMSGERDEATAWFRHLRDTIVGHLEALERDPAAKDTGFEPATFDITPWDRPEGGGGEMGLMREGRVFEKAGVNISTVHGEFSEAFRKEIPGADENPNFWAAGISLVFHPRSPHVPPVHMNTRFIVTTKWWFGGGADLNPIVANDEETKMFHQAFEACCDRHEAGDYPRFKEWADTYFYNKHRQEHRGVGGIFYDYINNGDFQSDLAFTKDVGTTLATIYPELVRKNFGRDWGDEERKHQLFRRGRYAEFNLVYDRGTRFGLMTNGNIDAILMSLPPLAAWP